MKVFSKKTTLKIKISRLLRHLVMKPPTPLPFIPKFWLLDCFFYLIDVLYMPELWMLSHNFLSKHTRPLTTQEVSFVKNYFGPDFPSDRVKMDFQQSRLSRRFATAYVTFYVVHYTRNMSQSLFMHEMVHIAQYHAFGSMYIGRCLLAQYSKQGYDYGGTDHLMLELNSGKRLSDFNFEQQASIVEHLYHYTNGSGSCTEDSALETANRIVSDEIKLWLESKV